MQIDRREILCVLVHQIVHRARKKRENLLSVLTLMKTRGNFIRRIIPFPEISLIERVDNDDLFICLAEDYHLFEVVIVIDEAFFSFIDTSARPTFCSI